MNGAPFPRAVNLRFILLVHALLSCLLKLQMKMSVDLAGVIPYSFLYQQHSPFLVENSLHPLHAALLELPDSLPGPGILREMI